MLLPSAAIRAAAGLRIVTRIEYHGNARAYNSREMRNDLSSTIRLASRPARGASKEMLPWNRRGRLADRDGMGMSVKSAPPAQF